MHTPVDDIQKPFGWHHLCYISENDTAYHETTCERLLVDLPHFGTGSGLMLAGGNYGCRLGRDYPDPALLDACYNDFQHNLRFSSCFGCRVMAICIRYPFEPDLALTGSLARDATALVRP